MTPLAGQGPLVIVMPRAAAEAAPAPANAVCISITNPRQSPAALPPGFLDVLRLGFHDTDQIGGNFVPMTLAQATEIIGFVKKHETKILVVHCEFGASRSLAVGQFVAAWLGRPWVSYSTDTLNPNPWVINHLRTGALLCGLRTLDRKLLRAGLTNPVTHLPPMQPRPE